METHYAYDSLHRTKQVWYTGLGGNDSGTVRPPLPAGVEQSGDVIIQYKTTAPGNGQVSQITDSAGHETYGYDGFGRTTSRNRVIIGSSATCNYAATAEASGAATTSGNNGANGHEESIHSDQPRLVS